MFDLMIVEDEYIVREDLKNLIDWESEGFNIVAEAKNGFEGLSFFERYHPRVVITDIKMPVMDGFEMIRELVKKDKGLKFIILTAYGEFDYARRAIEFGVDTYLLKHEIESDMMIEELDKIKGKIIEDEKIKESNFSKAFGKILNGRIEAEQIREMMANADFTFIPGYAFLIVADLQKYFGENSPGVPVSESEFKNILNLSVDMDYRVYFVAITEFRYAIFVKAVVPKSRQRLSDDISNMCLELQYEVEKHFQRHLSLAVSEPVYDLTGIKDYYCKTCDLIAYKLFRKTPVILFCETHQPIPKEIYDLNYKRYVKLLTEFNEKIKNGISADLKETVVSIYTDAVVKLEDVKLLQYTILETLGVVVESARKPEKSMELQQIFNEVNDFDNVYQICNWFLYLIDALFRCSDETYNRKIKNAIEYIGNNYKKDISLHGLADAIGVSTIYASQLFKKEIGESFITYLTKYRISKSIELLKTGKYKIYEVSEMIGYQSVQHFNKTFKKITGNKPSDYYK